MSALAAANPVKPTSQTLAQSEADLRTEATAIEKLRKQISEGGASASKEKMAEFAKRQKAYLDRKIDLEKLKRTPGEVPAAKPEPAKPSAEKKAEAPKPVAPEPAAKKTEPAKPEKSKPAEEPKAKDAPKTPEKKTDTQPAKPEKSSTKPEDPKAETSPAKKSSGISPIVWLLVVAAIAVTAWHFFG